MGGTRRFWARPWVRLTALVVGAAIILACAQVLFIVRGIRSPDVETSPDRVDAVVVFAGHRERLAAARELMDDRVAPTLVISLGEMTEGYEQRCADGEDFEVRCVRPTTVDTRGEARAFGELATAEGWSSLLAVTDSYHVERARIYLGRCFDGDLAFVGTGSGDPGYATVRHEFLGTLQASYLTRGC